MDPAFSRALQTRLNPFPERGLLNDRISGLSLTPSEQSEAHVVMEALYKSGGQIRTASVLIGMSHQEILRKMDKYGIPER